jgi:acetamidase/formamidase
MIARFLLAAALLAGASTAHAETHTFAPKTYYNTYSHAHPPALRIKSGDRVITKTIDARGFDEHGKQVHPGGNPETGPFYIEGAEPGDSIIVTIERVDINRTTAWSGSLLAPYATTPQAIAGRKDAEPRTVNWTLDKATMTAKLVDAGILPDGYTLPLRPMLGCIGVAPNAKEAIRANTPGDFGGNMDYAHLGAGARVTLPVFEPGALLFVGDGHARQGEGEVVGTGLETSMEVAFTVELVKKKAVRWPRLESATHIMVLGSSRNVLEAMQLSSAELQRLLMEDYGMTERGAQILMGQAGEYEVANVVDPAFTMVAKIRKDMLPKK